MDTPPATLEGRTIDLLADTWAREVPHDQFDLLRRVAPVFWHPEPAGSGFWAVTKHADVCTVSKDNATFSSELGGTFIEDTDEEALARTRLSFISMDPPKHSRYRRIVASAFTPKVVQQLEEDIEHRTTAVVDAVLDSGACEFVYDIAAVVPIQTNCNMFGIEADRWPQMLELSKVLVSTDADADTSAVAAMEAIALCSAEADARRAHPRDDLMTAMVQAEVGGDRLDELELIMFFITMLIAGNESTRYLISHALLAFIEHPDQAQRLRDDPSLWPTAVEELLRWGSSIATFRRTATRDVELNGVSIGAGDKVVMFYPSANRDEDVFAHPHRFDVGRTPNNHVAFGGGGIHSCLGASLSRTQIRTVMRRVNDRMVNPTLNGPVTRLRSAFMNGFVSMPITFTPTSSDRF